MKMNRRMMNTGSAEIYQPLNKKKMLTRTPYKKAPSEKRRAWQKTQTRKIARLLVNSPNIQVMIKLSLLFDKPGGEESICLQAKLKREERP
ncbi:MAG: hypothetical protein ACOYOS_19970 [Syntrophales bacterium]